MGRGGASFFEGAAYQDAAEVPRGKRPLTLKARRGFQVRGSSATLSWPFADIPLLKLHRSIARLLDEKE